MDVEASADGLVVSQFWLCLYHLTFVAVAAVVQHMHSVCSSWYTTNSYVANAICYYVHHMYMKRSLVSCSV